MRTLARRLTANASDADDLAQETWLRALRHPPREQGRLRSWLATVTRNLHLNQLRDRGRQRLVPLGEARTEAEIDTLSRDAGGTPEELLERVQIQRLLAELTLALAEPYRQVVILHYFEGLASSEIGQRVGVPPGTIRWRMKTALDQLRSALDERHQGDRQRWRALLLPLALPRLAKDAARPIQPWNPALAVSAVSAVGLAILFVHRCAGPDNPEAPIARKEVRSAPALLGNPPASEPTSGWETFVDGRVEDSQGRGVPGAVVSGIRTIPRNERTFSRLQPPNLLTAISGADGRFRFGPAVEGEFSITATARGLGSAALGPFEIAPTQPRPPLLLRLARSGTRLRGRVLDAGGGPVAQAHLLVSIQFGPMFQTYSDTHGQYELWAPSQATLGFRVDAAGYAIDQQLLDLEGLQEASRDVLLLPGGTVSGRVTTQAGLGLSRAEVSLEPISHISGGTPRGVVSAADGRFHLEGLVAGEYTVEARQANRVVKTGPLTIGAGSRIDLGALRAEEGIVLVGRVRSVAGAPIPGATVAMGVNGGLGRITSISLHRRTDDEGRFVFEGLVPASYLLYVDGQGYATLNVERRLEARISPAPLEFALEPAPRVEGRVLRADGAPAIDARIVARVQSVDGRSSREEVRTDQNGDFAFAPTRIGPLELAALLGDEIGTAESQQLVAGQKLNLTVKLAPGARVSGRVRFSNGRPITNTRIEGQGRARPMIDAHSVRTDKEGRYNIGPFLPGQASIVIMVLGERTRWSGPPRPEQRNVVLSPGEHRRDLDLTLPTAGPGLRGRVQAHDGEPIPGVAIVATAQNEKGQSRGGQVHTVTDSEGRFTFDPMPTGFVRAPGESPRARTLRPAGRLQPRPGGHPAARASGGPERAHHIPGRIASGRRHRPAGPVRTCLGNGGPAAAPGGHVRKPRARPSRRPGQVPLPPPTPRPIRRPRLHHR